MVKNEILTGVVDALGFNGEGIIRFDGTTVFVPYALVGEKVEFKVLKVKDRIAYGKLLNVVEPSAERAEPICPVFFKCGGCQLQHLSYESQLRLKEQIVKDCFYKIAGMSVNVDERVASPRPFGYRNKLQLPIRSEGGVTKVGFFKENSHVVVETDVCPIHREWAENIIAAVKDYVKACNVTAYDETSGKGLLRHVIVREVGGEFLIVLVINGKKAEKLQYLVERLFKCSIVHFSLFLNINTKNTNVITGDEYILVHGSGKIKIEEFSVNFELTPQAFFQVNTPVKNRIYSDVLSFVEDFGGTVVDAYAGAGVLTAMLSKKAKNAYGVEIIKEACDSARQLAKDNNIDNMSVICGDCKDVLPKLVTDLSNSGQKTVIVFDPPRKGVDTEIIEATLNAKPEKIVYISCSPQTLARDVGLLTGALVCENKEIKKSTQNQEFYKIERISIYDMFAQTKHVETLVCLSRKF